MNWQMIAEQNGITEPVNGSWLQAICESLGITEMVNGSWIQALAQYGPFPASEPLVNNSTLVGFEIYSYQAGAGPKGADIYEFEFTINANDETVGEEKILLVTNTENGFQVDPSNATPTRNMTARTIAIDGNTQTFYFGEFYTNSPDTLYYQTQLFNTVTGQFSDIKIFTILLEPPL